MIIITDLCLLGPQATFVEEGSQHILTKLPSNHRYIPLRANSLVSKCDSQKKKKKKKKRKRGPLEKGIILEMKQEKIQDESEGSCSIRR